MQHSSDRTAYLMLTGMAVCFGGTWVAGAVAVDAAPAFTIAATRFAIASILLYAWARLTNRPLSPISRADWPMVVGLGLTAVAGYNWLFLTGLTLAPASDGAIIVPGLAPVFTAVIAGFATRRAMLQRLAEGEATVTELAERFPLTVQAVSKHLKVLEGAGLVARRIVCAVAEGDVVAAGQRVGLIRFGSRCDVYLPDGYAPLVAVGQRAVAGETVFAAGRRNQPPRGLRRS